MKKKSVDKDSLNRSFIGPVVRSSIYFLLNLLFLGQVPFGSALCCLK